MASFLGQAALCTAAVRTKAAVVEWSAEAIADLIAIRDYIARFNPQAAEREAEKIIAAGDSLAIFPGREREIEGGRRELLTVKPYVIRYEYDDAIVGIITIGHGGRRSPP
jgi:toxin ParE1/3/4